MDMTLAFSPADTCHYMISSISSSRSHDTFKVTSRKTTVFFNGNEKRIVGNVYDLRIYDLEFDIQISKPSSTIYLPCVIPFVITFSLFIAS